MKPKGGSHLCLKCNTRRANHHSNTSGRMGKCSLDFYHDKTSHSHCLHHHPAWRNPATGEKQANLAVPGRNRFGVVTIVEAVNAVLKFLAYQSLIFPAALGIGQPHPLTQVFWVIWGCFATVCCKICKKAQTSATVVLWLNHKRGSQGQSEPPVQPQDRSWLEGKVWRDQKKCSFTWEIRMPCRRLAGLHSCVCREKGRKGLECWQPAEGAGQAGCHCHTPHAFV